MWLTKVRERKLQKGKIISTVWMRIDIEKLFCLCKKHKNVCVYIYIWRNAIKAKCAINSCSNEDMEMIGRTHYGRTAATHFTMSLYLVWKVLLVFSSICTERHFAAGDFLRDHLLGFFVQSLLIAGGTTVCVGPDPGRVVHFSFGEWNRRNGAGGSGVEAQWRRGEERSLLRTSWGEERGR